MPDKLLRTLFISLSATLAAIVAGLLLQAHEHGLGTMTVQDLVTITLFVLAAFVLVPQVWLLHRKLQREESKSGKRTTLEQERIVHTEEELRESKQLFHQLANAVPDVFWLSDLRSIIYISPAFERMWGIPVEAVLANRSLWMEHVHREDRPATEEAFRQRVERGKFEATYRVFHTDGTMRWVYDRGYPVKGGADDLFAGIVEDITERRQLEEELRQAHEQLEERVRERTQALRESENLFRIVADSSPAMSWLKDENKQVTFVSRAWVNYTGRPWEQEAGEGWLEGVHRDDLKRLLAAIDNGFSSQQPFTIEFRLRKHDGTFGWVSDQGVPRFLTDGRFAGFAGSAVDITDRKRRREEQELLTGVIRKTAGVSTVAELARITAEIIDKLLSWDFFFVAARSPADGRMRTLLLMDTFDGERREIPVEKPWNEDSLDAVVTEKPLLINRSADEARQDRLNLYGNTQRRSASLMFAAVHSELAVAGLLSVQSYTPNAFNEADAELLQKIADAIAPALRRCLLDETVREAQARVHAIIENALDAVITIDSDSVILEWNQQAETVFGWSRDEVIGRRLPGFIIPKQYRSAHERGVHRYLATGVGPVLNKRIEITALRRDGTEIDIELAITPFTTERGVEFSAFIRDISELKHAQESMRGRELADEANKAKSQFLSRMSHELRTPLNAVLGFARLLEMDELNEDQNDNLRQIIKAGRHLLSLINEVLDISKIEAGEISLSLEPVDMHEVVDEVYSLMQPLAAQRNVALECSTPCPGLHLFADKQRLKQVLLNLVANGIKYNKQGGSVNISCMAGEEERYRIVVSDTGPGIAPDDIPKLFSPFERLGAETSDVEGTGLGLALAQRLVHLMHGTIGVTSPPGTGSAFWVELPGKLETGKVSRDLTPVPEVNNKPSGVHGRILYIEDNLSNMRLIERIFTHRPNVRLVTAMQGQMGLDLATELVPDLVLLDLNLPDIHGSEVLARLRKNPRTAQIPVIVVSADATTAQIERLTAAGARAYITKPLNVAELLDAVDDVLNPRLESS